jgi:phenylpropionate dioxygenase-like ring-hydroxylating dioxygenase large terminal subunit
MNSISAEGALLPQAPDWKPGFSLPQHYYVNEEVFAKDLEILAKDWILIDHGSRIPNEGDFFTFEYGKESIIIVRGRDGQIGAFHNVCRHRGSRVCVKSSGTVNSFTCPYHAWTYDLKGVLKGAALMPAGFRKEAYNLKPCHVREIDGLIVINMSDRPPDLDAMLEPQKPFLDFLDIKQTKIAARRSYRTIANWKLVIENFSECYHCVPSHPTYSSVHAREKMLAVGAGYGSSDEALTQGYIPIHEKWLEYARSLGHPVGRNRSPIGPDKLTATVDGKPVSKLLGRFKQYDGGTTSIGFGSHTGFLQCTNDFGVIFRFVPRAPLTTDADAIWLVHRDALEGVDYDVERLIQVWDVTFKEDKIITENNQIGVLSTAYEPGPYSRQEMKLVEFTKWYAAKLASIKD